MNFVVTLYGCFLTSAKHHLTNFILLAIICFLFGIVFAVELNFWMIMFTWKKMYGHTKKRLQQPKK